MATNDPVVLVVEDEPGLSTLYVDWLEGCYETRTVRTGEAVLERLDGVDVVLLDRRLPDQSGDSVLDAIRERAPAVQVAMLTAVEADLDVADLPLDEYVQKPVGRAELFATVERLERRSHYEAATRRYHSLLARKHAIERQQDPTRRTDPAYEALLDRLERARKEADEHLDSFDDEDYRAMFERFERTASATAN